MRSRTRHPKIQVFRRLGFRRLDFRRLVPALALLAAFQAGVARAQATETPAAPAPSTAATVTIVAAGDIACDPANGNYRGGDGKAAACRQGATSDLALALAPDAVLVLGDNQYERGTAQQYRDSYDPTWGRLKSITHPAPGNHEYYTAGAAPYYAYFGDAAGDPTRGYYSFELGAWHLVALNSNCAEVGGCDAGSPQERWLRADLAAHPAACTLAFWHHPRYSSGPHGDHPAMAALWQALVDAGAEMALSGHDHDYERFAPQDAHGRRDDAAGMRQFVVGSGGRSHYRVNAPEANSEAIEDTSFGLLSLTLRPNGYDWRFVPVGAAGTDAADRGSATCH